MLTRILTSIVAIMVLLPVLFLSDTIVFPIAIALVTVIGLWEMFNCIGLKNKYAMTAPAFLAGAVLPFAVKYTSVAGSGLFSSLIVIYALYLFAAAVFGHKSVSVTDAAMAFISSVYVIGGFVCIQLLRELSSSIYLLSFIGAWMTDIFAYFSGRFFGKHKLCEAVSPKKTVEGSIGGILFCAISFVVFAMITNGVEMSAGHYAVWAAVGVVISVVSQIGDLSMSLVKRHYKIKDFGKLFPGHGGILDRFDSVIAVSFVLYIILAALTAWNVIIF